MAILPDCPGLKAEVLVNEQVLQEYDDNDDERNECPLTAVKYVEAVSNVNFVTRHSVEPPFPNDYALAGVTAIDGVYMDENIFHKDDLFRSHRSEGATKYIDGSSYQCKYRFSELVMDKYGHHGMTLDGLGDIALEFRIRVITEDVPLASVTKPENISKKAIAAGAISHHTRLDQSERQEEGWSGVDPVDEDPVATFIFKYRSLQSLKDLHIVPRSPSPTPEVKFVKKRTSKSAPTSGQQWKALSLENVKVLLNYHTGEKQSWEGLSREELEALLDYHRKKKAAKTESLKHKSNPAQKRQPSPQVEIKDEDDVIGSEKSTTKRQRIG